LTAQLTNVERMALTKQMQKSAPLSRLNLSPVVCDLSESAVFQRRGHRSCGSLVVKRMERDVHCITLDEHIFIQLCGIFVPVALGF